MAEVLNKMIAADAIVLATPVYFYTMAAQLKALIDRTVARYTEIAGKEFYFIVAAADGNIPNMRRTIESLRGFTSCLSGAREKGIVYGVGAWKKATSRARAACARPTNSEPRPDANREAHPAPAAHRPPAGHWPGATIHPNGKDIMHLLFKASLLVGGVVALAVIAGLLYLRQDKFGRLPAGDRLARIGGSANYHDGQFRNQVPIVRIVTGNSGLSAWIEFLFNKKSDTVPPAPIPAVKTDLKALGKDRDVVVWLGHSSYFVRMGGKTLLVDPVFSANASPVPLTTRAFDGTSIYTADDMPPIDILLISHDHWDTWTTTRSRRCAPGAARASPAAGWARTSRAGASPKAWGARRTGATP
jgi:hypothetical protein